MKHLLTLLLILATAISLSAQKKTDAKAESKIRQTLVGTWSLVLVDNISPDGKRTKPYGEQPFGLLMFDKAGNYSLQILRADRSKFASGDKTKGTDEENKSLVLGSNSHFGKYSINHADQTITFKVEHAFFPNWEGAAQIRPFTLTEQELKYTVPTTTNGTGVSGEVVWKRERY